MPVQSSKDLMTVLHEMTNDCALYAKFRIARNPNISLWQTLLPLIEVLEEMLLSRSCFQAKNESEHVKETDLSDRLA